MQRLLFLSLLITGQILHAQSEGVVGLVQRNVNTLAAFHIEFDEGPIRNLAEEIKVKIQSQVSAELAAAQAGNSADVLAGNISPMEVEVGSSDAEASLGVRQEAVACTNLNISRTLAGQLLERCHISEIYETCNSTRDQMSSLVEMATRKVQFASPQRARANRSVLAQLVTVQNELLRALDSSDAPVVACFEGLKTLASPTCLNTYRDVLTENLNYMVRYCLPSTIDEQINSFVNTVRVQRYSSILASAVNNYVQARESQIQLARIVQELTVTGAELLAQSQGSQVQTRGTATAPAPGSN